MSRPVIKNIRLLSTSLGTGALMSNLFKKEFPQTTVYNIVDDSVVRQIIANENVISADIVKRICAYVVAAEISGADLVVVCCSTISGIAAIAQALVSIPVLGIDEPMAELAIIQANRIMVLATMSSTLKPSLELLQSTAHAHNKISITIESSLVEEARRMLDAGKEDRHDQILKHAIENALTAYDIVILAQASMARVLSVLDNQTRNRVFTSPPIAVEAIRAKYFS